MLILKKLQFPRFFILLFAQMLLVFAVKATPPVLHLKSGESIYELTDYLEYLEDASGELVYEEVALSMADKFKLLKSSTDLYTGKPQTIWLKFRIKNDSDSERFLLSLGLLDDAFLFGGLSVRSDGMLTPYMDRENHFGRYPYMEINLFQEEEQTYYLKVHFSEPLTMRSAPSALPLHQMEIHHYSEVEESFNDSQYFVGIHAGIMIIMILYNLVVFFFINDRSYLFYILFIVFYLLGTSGLDGSAYEYFWGNSPQWNLVSVRHLLAIAWIFYLLFCQHFLSTKKKMPKWNAVLNAAILLQLAVLTLNIFNLWINWLDILQVTISMVVIFAVSIISSVKGYRPAIFYLIANVCLLLVIFMIALWGFGIARFNPFDYYVLQIGMTFQVVLFAAGLADRINLMQQKIVLQQNEKQELIHQQNQQLETRVKERTEELEYKNRLLTNQKREIVIQNKELEQQNEEITAQKELIEAQKESVSKAYQDIKVLKEMGRKINSTLDIREIIQLAYENISKLVTSTAFGIGTVDWDTERIEMIGYYKEGKHYPDYNIPLSQTKRLIVWSVLNNKDVYVQDYHAEYEKYAKQKFESETEREIPNSLIYIPLSLKGKVIGILLVQSERKYAFTPTHFDILKSLADYVTVGIDHAEAYSTVKEINDEMELKNTQIIDSLRYAKTIQDAILTDSDKFQKAFREHFIFYRAKDVVSGDFYWLAEKNNKVLIACVDCTGHGVPGAFMSMVGHELLNEIVVQKGVTDPALVLTLLHSGVRKALQQEIGKNDDGMDMSLCAIEWTEEGLVEVIFAGAKSSIFYTQYQELVELRGDKKSIGGMQKEKSRRFTNHKLTLSKGDMLYLATDGFFDQHNMDRRKFGKKNFISMLQEVSAKDLTSQRREIKANFENHKGAQYQRDDVTIIGIQL